LMALGCASNVNLLQKWVNIPFFKISLCVWSLINHCICHQPNISTINKNTALKKEEKKEEKREIQFFKEFFN
jgi:hypothetical protein